MFIDVMPLEVVPSVKASVTHWTRKAARLTMNGLSMSLQYFLGSEHLDAKVAHGRHAVPLGRRRGRRRRRRRRRRAVVSQQSRPSNSLVNRSVPPPPVGAHLGVSVARLSPKSVGCILDRKKRPIVDEQILDVSSDFLE